ncbi:MAG: hypothetical protein KDD49_03890 [Bacteroidetes bacterium]|nr:hypothetical protein [Bacteroidota bacterium]
MAKQKYIQTPEKMWELFTQYKKWANDNPILVEDYIGKDAVRIERKRQRCLTMEGFENYVAGIDGMPMDLGDYFANTNNKYSEYSTICSRIRRVIRQDQIEGGMCGIYNPSITQRLNGLADKQQHEGGDPNNPIRNEIITKVIFEDYTEKK